MLQRLTIGFGNSTRRCVCYGALTVSALLADSFLSAVDAHAESTSDGILAQLAAFDDLYMSGLTARGIEIESRIDLASAFVGGKSSGALNHDRTSSLSFTTATDRRTLVNEYVMQSPDVAIPGESGPRSDFWHKSVVVIAGDRMTTRLFRSADETEGTGNWITVNSSVSSGELELVKQRVLWSLGRGFSRYLDLITSISGKAALIEIEASGSFPGDEGNGTWSLTVDPTRTYIVTRATYTASDGSRRMLSMEASDFVVNGDCVFPRFASIDRPALQQFQHEYTEATLTFDDELYEEALALATAEAPDGSLDIDQRVNPPLAKVVGAEDPPVPAVLRSPSENVRRIRLLLIIGNALLIAGVAGWIVYRRRQAA